MIGMAAPGCAAWESYAAQRLCGRIVVSAAYDDAVEERLELARDAAARLRANIETVVIGKPNQIRLVLTALACRGHVLLEDVPGTAKTVLARALAGSIEGSISTRNLPKCWNSA